jgi:hypothetical protein
VGSARGAGREEPVLLSLADAVEAEAASLGGIAGRGGLDAAALARSLRDSGADLLFLAAPGTDQRRPDREGREGSGASGSGCHPEAAAAHPSEPDQEVAPPLHTASRRAYLELREAYSRFIAVFRDAAEKLKAGDRLASFPDGTARASASSLSSESWRLKGDVAELGTNLAA